MTGARTVSWNHETPRSLTVATIEKTGESLGKVGEFVPFGLAVPDPNIARRDPEALKLTRQPGFVNSKQRCTPCFVNSVIEDESASDEARREATS